MRNQQLITSPEGDRAIMTVAHDGVDVAVEEIFTLPPTSAAPGRKTDQVSFTTYSVIGSSRFHH